MQAVDDMVVLSVESGGGGRRTFYFSYNKQQNNIASAAAISTINYDVFWGFNVTCHLKYKNAHFMLSAAPHENSYTQIGRQICSVRQSSY